MVDRGGSWPHSLIVRLGAVRDPGRCGHAQELDPMDHDVVFGHGYSPEKWIENHGRGWCPPECGNGGFRVLGLLWMRQA